MLLLLLLLLSLMLLLLIPPSSPLLLLLLLLLLMPMSIALRRLRSYGDIALYRMMEIDASRGLVGADSLERIRFVQSGVLTTAVMTT